MLGREKPIFIGTPSSEDGRHCKAESSLGIRRFAGYCLKQFAEKQRLQWPQTPRAVVLRLLPDFKANLNC
jgi:hypothetical protein